MTYLVIVEITPTDNTKTIFWKKGSNNRTIFSYEWCLLNENLFVRETVLLIETTTFYNKLQKCVFICSYLRLIGAFVDNFYMLLFPIIFLKDIILLLHV